MTEPIPTRLADGDQCVMNIGPREQRKRLESGVDAFCVAQLLAAFLVIAPVHRFWLFVVALPLWLAGSGYFQYGDRTCLRLASRGQRDFDDGPEAILDSVERAQVRRQARAIQIKSLVFTIAGTALAFVIAELVG